MLPDSPGRGMDEFKYGPSSRRDLMHWLLEYGAGCFVGLLVGELAGGWERYFFEE